MNPPGNPPASDVESLPGQLNSAPVTVRLGQEESGHWQLYKNGAPYTIRGAGGVEHLECLAAAGGNTLRTWGVEQLESPGTEGTLLDRCEALNISVVLGLWVTHSRHGADYRDPTFLQSQRDRIRHAVERYRHHPAVLMWGLGNEMEEDGNDPDVWRELEVLAQLIKSADSTHPVCTVLAGTGNQKVAALMEHCPSFDLVGINIYDGADQVDAALASQGWDRPYLLTEFGPSNRQLPPKRRPTRQLTTRNFRKAADFVSGPFASSGAINKKPPQRGLACSWSQAKRPQWWMP